MTHREPVLVNKKTINSFKVFEHLKYTLCKLLNIPSAIILFIVKQDFPCIA